MHHWCEETIGQRGNKRYAALCCLFAISAALMLPGIASGQAVRASGAPNPPTNVHVTGISGDGTSGYFVSIAFTPPDATSPIAVSNGPQMFARSAGISTDTEYIGISGAWVCLSLAAYNDSGTSSWTPWLCTEAPGVPNVPWYVHQTTATTSSVSFAWSSPYPSAGIAVSNGTVVTAFPLGATTYAQPVAAGYWTCLSVAAYNSSGASAWSPWVCGFAVPATPSGVHVTNQTTSSVSFAWTDNDPYSGIAVSNGSVVTSLHPGASTYTESGMTAGSTVCISTLAYNSAIPSGASGWSTWVCGQAV